MVCTHCELDIDPGDDIVSLTYGIAKYSNKSKMLGIEATGDPQIFHEDCLVDMAIENGWIDEDVIYDQIRQSVEQDIREEVIQELEELGLLIPG